MKKLLLFALFAGLSQFAFSQVMVNDVDINELDIQYIEVQHGEGIPGLVRINYGQEPTTVFNIFDPLVNTEGKPFRNHVAALNFLYNQGWELILTGDLRGNDEAPAFIMQRREQRAESRE